MGSNQELAEFKTHEAYRHTAPIYSRYFVRRETNSSHFIRRCSFAADGRAFSWAKSLFVNRTARLFAYPNEHGRRYGELAIFIRRACSTQGVDASRTSLGSRCQHARARPYTIPLDYRSWSTMEEMRKEVKI